MTLHNLTTIHVAINKPYTTVSIISHDPETIFWTKVLPTKVVVDHAMPRQWDGSEVWLTNVALRVARGQLIYNLFITMSRLPVLLTQTGRIAKVSLFYKDIKI